MTEWRHIDRFETTATTTCRGLRLRVVASFSTGAAHATAAAFAAPPDAPEVEIPLAIAEVSLDEALDVACAAAIRYATDRAVDT